MYAVLHSLTSNQKVSYCEKSFYSLPHKLPHSPLADLKVVPGAIRLIKGRIWQYMKTIWSVSFNTGKQENEMYITRILVLTHLDRLIRCNISNKK